MIVSALSLSVTLGFYPQAPFLELLDPHVQSLFPNVFYITVSESRFSISDFWDSRKIEGPGDFDLFAVWVSVFSAWTIFTRRQLRVEKIKPSGLSAVTKLGLSFPCTKEINSVGKNFIKTIESLCFRDLSKYVFFGIVSPTIVSRALKNQSLQLILIAVDTFWTLKSFWIGYWFWLRKKTDSWPQVCSTTMVALWMIWGCCWTFLSTKSCFHWLDWLIVSLTEC